MEDMEKTNEMEKSACGCECAEAQQVERAEEKAPRRAYVPAVDLIDSESEIHIVADVPGVAEGGVDLNLEKNILTLVAVPADGVIAGKKLIYSEYGVGEYRRTFALSEDIDKDNIVATLKNGVLRITLPKVKPASRKIQIASN